MKKKYFLYAIVGLTLTIACMAANLKAQTIESSPSSTLTITDVELTSRENLNFKTFDVYAEEAGNYYAEFWILPARYADGSYTTFKVYLNGKDAGEITPTEGNWQSARMAGNETLDLIKGINRIAISTTAPEIPAVETVSIAAKDIDASISSVAYEDYLADAFSEMVFDYHESQKTDAVLSTSEQSGPVYMNNVPFSYTFYRVFSFMTNQSISITTTSESEHNIDMVFIGREYTSTSESDSYIDNIGTCSIESSKTVYGDGSKLVKMRYNRATSEEMQGLNWKGISRRALNSSKHIASLNVSAPQSGLYLIRVRHNENFNSGIADVIINGNYYYENMPISFHSIDCVMPKDINAYSAMTMSDPSDVSDPMIFIHGAVGDRIVGFNDDAPIDKVNQYNLSKGDAYIAQKYIYPTSKISVNSYSSASPRSYCDIYGRVKENLIHGAMNKRPESKNTESRLKNSSKSADKKSVDIIGDLDSNGVLTISAKEKIFNIRIFNTSGNCLGYVKCNVEYVSIPLANINIKDNGIYLLMVETENEIVTKKIFVKNL